MLAQHERPTIPPHAVSQLASTSPVAQVIRPATVKGLHRCGYSWAEIGSRLGITRQAAQQRWTASS